MDALAVAQVEVMYGQVGDGDCWPSKLGKNSWRLKKFNTYFTKVNGLKRIAQTFFLMYCVKMKIYYYLISKICFPR